TVKPAPTTVLSNTSCFMTIIPLSGNVSCRALLPCHTCRSDSRCGRTCGDSQRLGGAPHAPLSVHLHRRRAVTPGQVARRRSQGLSVRAEVTTPGGEGAPLSSTKTAWVGVFDVLAGMMLRR